MKPDYMQKSSWGFKYVARNPHNEYILCLEKYIQDLDTVEFRWRVIPSEGSRKKIPIHALIPEISEEKFLKILKNSQKLPIAVISLYPTQEINNIKNFLLWAKTGEFLINPFAGQPHEVSREELEKKLLAKKLEKLSERYVGRWGETSYVILYDGGLSDTDESQAESKMLPSLIEELLKAGALLYKKFSNRERGVKMALPRESEALKIIRKRTKDELALHRLRIRTAEPVTPNKILAKGLLIGFFSDPEKNKICSISVP